MRILHIITSLYYGGAERLMVDLLPLLRDGGSNDVDLLLINGVETPFKNEVMGRGINVHWLSPTNDVYHPRNLWRMRKYMAGYDIIHTHNTAPQLFASISKALSNTKAKLVTTEHSSDNRRRSKWWLKPLDLWMYNRYVAIVCIADPARENLEAYIGKKKNIHTISNGVNIERFIRPINDVKEKENFVVTMVAAFRYEKDHKTLFRAVKRLPENYRLQLVGGGEDQQLIKNMCHDMGLDDRVEFLGVRSDVPDILESSDVVVLSSHREGLSLSSIEGMASGRPFVASDVDGLHEMVDGAGVLFPHGDDAALAEKIQWLCEHPEEYRQIAQRCQDKARQFDIKVTAQKYLDLYKSLLKK